MMDKFKKTQILKLLLIAILVSVTPLLSTSLRPPYLYFVFNLIIVALGAEAGLLSFILKAAPAEDKKFLPPNSSNIVTHHDETQKTGIDAIIIPSDQDSRITAEKEKSAANKKLLETMLLESDQPTAATTTKRNQKVPEKKIVAAVKICKIVKTSPSTPSLFFIAGGTGDHEDEVAEDFFRRSDIVVDDEQQQEFGAGDQELIGGQELFHKAETFIGNFYKQLKMQREDSWKKLHEFYHKAF